LSLVIGVVGIDILSAGALHRALLEGTRIRLSRLFQSHDAGDTPPQPPKPNPLTDPSNDDLLSPGQLRIINTGGMTIFSSDPLPPPSEMERIRVQMAWLEDIKKRQPLTDAQARALKALKKRWNRLIRDPSEQR